jgi:hypothetical protein
MNCVPGCNGNHTLSMAVDRSKLAGSKSFAVIGSAGEPLPGLDGPPCWLPELEHADAHIMAAETAATAANRRDRMSNSSRTRASRGVTAALAVRVCLLRASVCPCGEAGLRHPP